MNAKNYLKQYKRILERLRQMKKELDTIEAQMETTGGIGDGMPRGTDISDKTGRLASMLADLKSQYEWITAESWLIRKDIEATINQVEDPLQSRLLYDRYIQGMSWRDVANEIHMDEVYTRGRLHGSALEAVRKIREKLH